MARPRKTLTAEQVAEVETLAAVLTQEQIADYFGISHDTFSRMCERDENVLRSYKKGKSKAIGSVAKNLLTQAREGNTSAAIFYLKTQAGWRETDMQRDDTPQSLNINFEVKPAAGDVKVTHGKS